MSFPVLEAALTGDRSVARLLECALRHERLVVPLATPVKQPGPHFLEAKLSDGGTVRVLAEPVGPPQIAGQLLSLSVVDRGQMATILALVEKLDRPVAPKTPPAGSTLESRIPFIEDAMTTAAPRPKLTEAATPAAKATTTTASPATQANLPPKPSPGKSAPPASSASPPSSVEVEVEIVDDAEAYGDDDDAPTLMQQSPSPGQGAPNAPALAPRAQVAPSAVEKQEYVPVLAITVSNDPASFADTLMPPSSMVERTLLLPVGQGGVHAPSPSPAAGRPPPKPEEKSPARPALQPAQTARIAAARPQPIPREEPGARPDPRAEEAGPTELHRRPQRSAKDAPAKAPSEAEASAPPARAATPPPPAAAPQAAQGMSVREPAAEAPRPAPAPRLIGRTIAGKYTIDSSIGRGATAEVFRAQHTSLKRPVAIKILHQENAGFLQFVKRFKAEAHTLSKLEHQNIARVIDFGQEPDGLLYLVMELLVGKSLEVMLGESATKLSARKVIDIGVQTCNALAFAHDEGVIHRDVKPENVILVPHRDEDGKPIDLVKVCDFGLAKLRDPDPENTDITMGGAVCGSPAYMSPEQIVGEKLDARADLYALSTMLFEALTGNLPHDAIGLTQLFAKKLLELPTPIRSFLPDVDPGLEACIMKGLSRDRTARQDDARVFRQELRAALAKLPA